MVNLEDPVRSDFRYPVRATIEAGAEDDDLIDALTKGCTDVVINEAGPRDA
ncbi:MAG: hypothetical protein ABSD89_00530 [Halobacteriota archaeon]|jgi:hypothetical protein